MRGGVGGGLVTFGMFSYTVRKKIYIKFHLIINNFTPVWLVVMHVNRNLHVGVMTSLTRSGVICASDGDLC